MQAIASHQTKLAVALAIPPTMAMPMAAPVARYVTINQAAELRPAFSPAALRDLKFKAFDRKSSAGDIIKGNGTGPAGVWVQLGAKVLLDLEALDRWIESHKVVALK